MKIWGETPTVRVPPLEDSAERRPVLTLRSPCGCRTPSTQGTQLPAARGGRSGWVTSGPVLVEKLNNFGISWEHGEEY